MNDLDFTAAQSALLQPTEFWGERDIDPDFRTLAQETKRLPAFDTLSPHFLTRIIYVFAKTHINHFNKEKSYIVRDLWKPKRVSWFSATEDKLREHETQDKNAFIPQSFANISWALYKLRDLVPDSFSDAFYLAATKSLPDFEARHLAILHYTSASVGLSAPQSFLVSFEKSVTDKAMDFNDRNIANLLHGYLGRSSKPSQTMTDALFMASIPKIPQFKLQNMSQIFRDIYELGVYPPQACIEPLMKRAQDLYPEATGPALIGLDAGLAFLKKLPVLPEKQCPFTMMQEQNL